MIGGNAMEPGGNLRLGFKAVGVLVDLEKDLLDCVFRFQVVPQKPVGYLVDPLLVAPDELLQGLRVPPRQPLEQGIIEISGVGAQNGVRKMPWSFFKARSNSRCRSTANSRRTSSSLIPRAEVASTKDTSPFSWTSS